MAVLSLLWALLMTLCTIRFGTLFSVVQFLKWWDAPGLFLRACQVATMCVPHSMHIWAVCKTVPITVQLLHCWHDGTPPECPPHIPKRRHHWRRLTHQFCQLLKSWTHTIQHWTHRSKISASEQLTQLHWKLKGVIFAHANSRRLHIRKLLAFKHHS